MPKVPGLITASAVSMQFGVMLKMEVPSKFSTVALQQSKSSAFVHGVGRIETPVTCTFNIHSLSLSNTKHDVFIILHFFGDC